MTGLDGAAPAGEALGGAILRSPGNEGSPKVLQKDLNEIATQPDRGFGLSGGSVNAGFAGCRTRVQDQDRRGYGLRHSRLKGHQGQRIWTGWAILAYNLDTLAVHTTRNHPRRSNTEHQPTRRNGRPHPRSGRFTVQRLSGGSS